MIHLLLYKIDPGTVCDFLNETTIEFEVISVNDFYLNDSATHTRVMHMSDKILFKSVSSEEENFLRLKFGNSIETCVVETMDK